MIGVVLACGDCGSLALSVEKASYGERTAFEVHECEDCGNRGSLQYDGRQSTLDGLKSVERRDQYGLRY